MLWLIIGLAYLCGAIPFGVLAGRLRGVDLQSVGSRNIGATNVWRTLGPAMGSTVFVLDVLKGLAGPTLAKVLLPHDALAVALCAVAAVLGHVFSVFLGFRGGKGIATALGAGLALDPLVALGAFALWGLLLLLTRTISVASMLAVPAAAVAMVALHRPVPLTVVVWVLACLTLLKHRPNMQRLRDGTEPRLGRGRARPGAAASETPKPAAGAPAP